MGRYHQDEETRVEGERHAAIVFKDNQILLINRIKHGCEYFVFPGGHRREEEMGNKAVLRELFEETGVVCTNPKIAIKFRESTTGNINYYYLCDWVSGEDPHLTGEELNADPKEDFFDPMWINLAEIEKLNILPAYAKTWLTDYVNNL